MRYPTWPRNLLESQTATQVWPRNLVDEPKKSNKF